MVNHNRRVTVNKAIMTRLIAGIALTLIASLAWAAAPGDPVKIDAGLINGVSGASAGSRVYAGIPFAAPPLGNLRWKPPQPVKPWEGVRDCSAFGPWCPQPKPMLGKELGKLSEDCLYLNVWTSAKNYEARLPVMFWIHGGGCTTGSGGSSYYNGEALAKQGVVVVTINYRLGPFGFFAHPLLSQESEHGVSGNYGLLDQIAALQWVQRNIARFGGDPNCVTIFGESAGSASVCRLMVSPLAKGLFHRAIAESGGAEGRDRHLKQDVGRVEAMEKIGQRIATKLGCDKAPYVLAELRAKSADELLSASDPAQGLFGKGTKFGWIVDGWVLPDDPGALFAAGKQAPVPFIAGTNADEGTIFLQQLPGLHVMGYKLTVRTVFREQAPQYLALYPVTQDDQVRAALSRLTTIGAFVYPARADARAQAKIDAKTFLYHFTRVPPYVRGRDYGAFHSAEIGYVFGNLVPMGTFEPLDKGLSRTMSACWVQFAKTGDPNGPGLPQWPAYDAVGDKYLEFGDQVKVGAGLYREACDLLAQVRGGGF